MMRRFWFALLVGGLLVLPAVSSASPAPAKARPVPPAAGPASSPSDSYEQSGSRMAAVRIRNWVEGYQKPPFYAGSGTLVAIADDGALVLTAGHLFEDKVGPITVEFADGQISGARILAVDQTVDVAALWIFAPKQIEPVPLGEHDPPTGEHVEIWGYGPRRFRSFTAEIRSAPPVLSEDQPWLLAAQGTHDKQVTIFGDSGGPIVQNGKLVALHWGYANKTGDSERYVRAVGCDKLRDWLKANVAERVWRRAAASPRSEG